MARRILCCAVMSAAVSACAPPPERVGEAAHELGSFSFDTNEVFDSNTGLPAAKQRGTDPFVRVASNGDIYVASTSFPVDPFLSDGGSLWRSTDNGALWTYLGTADLPDHMGAECSMHLDGSGRLWMAELIYGANAAPI